jgi:hypothetical protein
MELMSVKNTLDKVLNQIENIADNRLNQIENRFAHLEGRQNRPASRKGYDNDYSYEDANSDYYHNY